jgi:predicted Zn-dependent protease with MMP-like domain
VAAMTDPQIPHADGSGRPPRRRRRDRRGRGLRGDLGPRTLPFVRTASETFDDLVLDAVAHLEPMWGAQLSRVDFAVEDVPEIRPEGDNDYDDRVVEDAQIPLGRVLDAAESESGQPMIVLYRRPLESRAYDAEDLADLVLEVVVDRLAHILDKDPDEIDPPV